MWHFPLELRIFSKLPIFHVHYLIPTNISKGLQRSKLKGAKEALLNKVIYIVNQELRPKRNANHHVSRERTVVVFGWRSHPRDKQKIWLSSSGLLLCMWSYLVSVFKFIEIIFWVNPGQNSNLGFNCWSSKQDVQIFPQSNKPSVNGVIPTHNALLDQQEMYLG